MRYLVENQVQSSYAARNKGISQAVGSLISFVDANVKVNKDFLQGIEKFFGINIVDYLGNRVEIEIIKDSLTARYNRMTDFSVGSDIRDNHYAPTCCLTVRRSVFDKVGVFDQRVESGGDWDFGQRVFQANLKQDYCADIVVYHPARFSYGSLIKKGKRIARGISQLSYYSPQEYNHLFKRYFQIRRYLPRNPLQIYKQYKSMYNDTTYTHTLAYAFFHIPIRFVALIELIKEKFKLRISRR